MRELKDLISVGKATLDDFDQLGVSSVSELASQNAEKLYERLTHIQGQKVDPCCKDVFQAAIEQARDPKLPMEKCQWWYWSRLRKGKEA